MRTIWFWTVILVLSAASRVSFAAPCGTPPAGAEKLRVYLTYLNGHGSNKPTDEPFSVVVMGERVFFRANKPLAYWDPKQRPVYVYAPVHPIDALTCPSDATWTGCVADWVSRPPDAGNKVMYGNEEPHYSALDEPTCEFTLHIPVWKPSPDDARKKKVAAEILNEVLEFRHVKPKAIYVRDFNLEDADISIYIIPRKGEPEFQGCAFELDRSPHCVWHMFGQSPLKALRREIMRRPYRLYPPPIGKL